MAIVSAHKSRTSPQAKPAHKAPLAERSLTQPAVIWSHVPLVPQVALVGHLNGMPVAVIDQIGSAGFRAGLCDGTSVGVFRTLEECKQAVAAAIQETPKHAHSA